MHQISLMTMVLPRLELPFIIDWIDYYVKFGITQLYLGIDISQRKNWKKKPNPKYYSSHLNDSSFEKEWNKILSQIEKKVNVIKIEINTNNYPDNSKHQGVIKAQNDFMHYVQLRSPLETEWILNCDIDEFLYIKRFSLKEYLELFKDLPDLGAIYFQQKVCESRWKNEKPLKHTEIKNACSRFVEMGKYIYRPSITRPYSIHNVIKSCTCIHSSVKEAYLCHFRGNEWAENTKMQNLIFDQKLNLFSH